jgi:heme-degrading monooxygenase HmoA
LKIPVTQLQPELERSGAPLLEQQHGFRALYFVQNDAEHSTVILLWEDAASAQAGAQAFGPTWFHQHIAPHLASEQQRSGGEVLVQRTRPAL